MHAALPDRIDPARLAVQGAWFEGRVALRTMERLVPLLAGEPGEAEVEMEFAVDTRGLRTVHGRVRAELVLTCQRCLEPVAVQVDGAFHLAVVASQTEAGRLPEGLEPLDCDADGKVATAQHTQFVVAEKSEEGSINYNNYIPTNERPRVQ